MAVRIPARNVAGDQIMESVTNANTREEQVVRIGGSFPAAAITGTINTSTGTVTETDLTEAGTVLVMVHGTYAGANLVFEGLNSAGGNSIWVPIAGARVDGSKLEYQTGVLPANTSMAWRFPAARINQFRVRNTALTSGTINVIIDSAIPWGEPVVNALISPPATRVDATFGTVTAGVAGSTTEALITTTPVRDAAAGTAANNHSPTAGKTLWIETLSITVANTAATQNGLRAYIRAVPTGTVTTTSPIIAFAGIAAPNAVSGGMQGTTLLVNKRIPPGWNFGVSVVNAINSGTNWVYVSGYEF